VAFDSDPGTGAWITDSYNLSDSNPWEVVGGTSLAAPAWAGLVAIADQGRVQAGESTLGTNGPTEAQTALYTVPSSDYNAVTTGTNGYSAGSGYNLVTGLGTPEANLLIPDLVAYDGQAMNAGSAGEQAISSADLNLDSSILINSGDSETNGLAEVNTLVASPTSPHTAAIAPANTSVASSALNNATPDSSNEPVANMHHHTTAVVTAPTSPTTTVAIQQTLAATPLSSNSGTGTKSASTPVVGQTSTVHTARKVDDGVSTVSSKKTVGTTVSNNASTASYDDILDSMVEGIWLGQSTDDRATVIAAKHTTLVPVALTRDSQSKSTLSN
jgi:hypothetical protein